MSAARVAARVPCVTREEQLAARVPEDPTVRQGRPDGVRRRDPVGGGGAGRPPERGGPSPATAVRGG